MRAMKKALILYDCFSEGGHNPDQRDALIQAQAVAGALREIGWEPMELSLSLDVAAFVNALGTIHPAFVFNLVESLEGHGRLIHLAPAVLDILGVPYTGSKTDSVFLTSNKRMAKERLKAAALPTPPGFWQRDLRGKAFPIEGRYIVKSTWEHASIGLGEDSVVDAGNAARLHAAIEQRRERLGGDCFAEVFVEGREFNLSLLSSQEGPEVLPPAEILFEDYPPEKLKMVDYRAKWEEDSFESLHTQRRFDFPVSDGPLLRRLESLAKRCWDLFDLRGYGRVDFRVDGENQPWILEINTNPCLSPDAGFIAAAMQAGLPFRAVVERILGDSGIEERSPEAG